MSKLQKHRRVQSDTINATQSSDLDAENVGQCKSRHHKGYFKQGKTKTRTLQIQSLFYGFKGGIFADSISELQFR